jgi:hypothetical protein
MMCIDRGSVLLFSVEFWVHVHTLLFYSVWKKDDNVRVAARIQH